MSHDAKQLEALFEVCFFEVYQTRLEGGAPEPLYLASEDPARTPHRILYREDFFASALHEVAHWCLAGARRRRLEDYGYWYAADGRSPRQQSEFESVEARPQAIESIFSEACGFIFHLSADNLSGGMDASRAFGAAVDRERRILIESGLPPRAETFRRGLERLEFESCAADALAGPSGSRVP